MTIIHFQIAVCNVEQTFDHIKTYIIRHLRFFTHIGRKHQQFSLKKSVKMHLVAYELLKMKNHVALFQTSIIHPKNITVGFTNVYEK